nr:MAG TPA: MmpL11 D2 family, MEMBRANE PROTEIN.4A [Caudoviricetes sp.]
MLPSVTFVTIFGADNMSNLLSSVLSLAGPVQKLYHRDEGKTI